MKWTPGSSRGLLALLQLVQDLLHVLFRQVLVVVVVNLKTDIFMHKEHFHFTLHSKSMHAK
jgi:hypothetical protein